MNLYLFKDRHGQYSLETCKEDAITAVRKGVNLCFYSNKRRARAIARMLNIASMRRGSIVQITGITAKFIYGQKGK